MPESEKPFDKEMGMIPDEALHAVLPRYGYGDADWLVLPFLDVGEGFISITKRSETASKAVVRTDDALLLIKQLPWYLPGEHAVEFVSNLQATLADTELPIPAVLPTDDGNYVVEYDGAFYHVQEFITAPDVPEDRRYRNSGRLLARMHEIARDMDGLDEYRDYREFCDDEANDITQVLSDVIERGEEDVPADDRKTVTEYCETVTGRLAELRASLRNRNYRHGVQPIHGDFNPTNALTDEGGVYAVVDFDNACYSRPEHDVAGMLLSYTVFTYKQDSAIYDGIPTTVDEREAERLLKAYRSEADELLDPVVLPAVAETIYYECCSLGLVRGDFALADAITLFEFGDTVRRKFERLVEGRL